MARSLTGVQLAGSVNIAMRNTLVDVASKWSLLIIQFVDDTFTFVSNSASLRAVNSALSTFCTAWRHRFQGGRKRPTVMALGSSVPVPEARGSVCGEIPQEANYLDCLGIPIDRGLTLQLLLDRVCSRLLQGVSELQCAVEAEGFGFPYACAQCPSRVKNSALHGAELLVSHVAGWPHVARQLKNVQYRMGKQLLGVRASDSLGEGGVVKVLCETRFVMRLSTKVAVRAMLARARLLALPQDSPLEGVLGAAVARRGPTWLDQVRVLTMELGIVPDIVEFGPFASLDRSCAVDRKQVVSCWKRHVVIPQVGRLDDEWFRSQLAKLVPVECVRFGLYLSSRCSFAPGLSWASWGSTTWRCFKTWCAVRASGGMPLSIWGAAGLVFTVPYCPLCGAPEADLEHVVAACVGTVRSREQFPSLPTACLVEWLLRGADGDGDVVARVRHAGLSVAAIARSGDWM